MGKRRKGTGTAEVDEGNEVEEASAVTTTMRPMEEERRKPMSRRMMREKARRKEIFKFSIDFTSHPP